MYSLSAIAKLEKNKISSTGTWLVLIEIQFQGETIRVVNNNEDIEWPTGSGTIWTGFPFELGEVSENSKGELPSLQLKVSNVTRTIQQYLEEYAGGTDATVILRVVMSEHLELTTPELIETFSVKSTSTSAQWATFNLGPDCATTQRIPPDRYMQNFCPFKFKGIKCGYSGSESSCNKTLASCRVCHNSTRFGGEPGIPGAGGLYVSS
ncbi:DUF1833 family protein [Halocella sp. SP3-1]|uniref:DUF1833 family protein n=1 Tax=Halocella sp. SP3-1 TaxID=2382161 RepID=UPI000F7565B3|nr:DUF1833 family protein [Halocella sp. SP3-1]AZO96084.1 hypothetical protein D7D81_16630 [Halocella sp. SP3-1]